MTEYAKPCPRCEMLYPGDCWVHGCKDESCMCDGCIDYFCVDQDIYGMDDDQ